MARIYYTASNYTGLFAHINTVGEQPLVCNKIDLYRAITTVGCPSYISWAKIRQFGLLRALSDSIIQKWLLVHDNIESRNGSLVLHDIFRHHVSDHKRIVSYNLGMAFAKIYAEKLLEIPNLIHVETLKKQGAITFHNTNGEKKEPDLVGLTANGNWHVFEAKGVSRNQLNTKILEAKEQANEVDTIHGSPPVTMSACATYFNHQRITSKIEDPEGKQKKQIEIKTDEYFETYYSPFLSIKELLNEDPKKERFEESSYYHYRILTDKLNLTIGLDEEVYELIQEKNYHEIRYFLEKKKSLKKELQHEDTENYSIGDDGYTFRYTKKNSK